MPGEEVGQILELQFCFGPSTSQSNCSREKEETEKDTESQIKVLTGKGTAMT